MPLGFRAGQYVRGTPPYDHFGIGRITSLTWYATLYRGESVYAVYFGAFDRTVWLNASKLRPAGWSGKNGRRVQLCPCRR